MRPGGRGRRQYQQKQKLARQKIKATNAAAVEAAGAGRSPMSHILNTKIKKIHDAWLRDNGYKPQAASVKLRSSFVESTKPEDLHAANSIRFVEAASRKRQAPSNKPQAPSPKRPSP